MYVLWVPTTVTTVLYKDLQQHLKSRFHLVSAWASEIKILALKLDQVPRCKINTGENKFIFQLFYIQQMTFSVLKRLHYNLRLTCALKQYMYWAFYMQSCI